MRWILFFTFLCVSAMGNSEPSRKDAVKILQNRSINRKIDDLENFVFHSLETDQFIYELRVINPEISPGPEYLCLYIIPVYRLLDIAASGILPFYHDKFESCE